MEVAVGESMTTQHTPTERICDSCGERHVTVQDRDNGTAECTECWRSALAHGHAHGLHQSEAGYAILIDDCPDCHGRTYTVLATWQDHPDGLREEHREYHAASLSEALMMAERADAGRPNAPDAYGILPEDYAQARAEGIQFNEADGLLI